MYKLLLILRYLRKRRIAWVSLIAVMLCTTMVLVVISVMGGWLETFRESFHGMSGDVVVRSEGTAGFPAYQEMIDRVKELPEVVEAAPVIRSFGLINIDATHARGPIQKGVQVMGFTPEICRVNRFCQSLYLHKGWADPFALNRDVPYGSIKPANVKADVTKWPGMIVGGGVIGLTKDKKGNVNRPDIMYSAWVRLSMLPLDPKRAKIEIPEQQERMFWIVDDSRTRMYVFDANTVYIPFADAQQLQNMNQREVFRKIGDTEVKEIEPARAHEVQIALKAGVNLNAAREKIHEVVDRVAAKNGFGPLVTGLRDFFPYKVETWQEANSQYIGAVETEKVLVTVLFGIISIVAIFLIFCIFYMIVVEKTRDIGIIKSIGATSSGITSIFLGYGAAIGVVGAFMGLGLGYLIVHYINELHALIGEWMGVVIFKPETYQFDSIPNRMNPSEVTIIVIIAIISSIIGALVPAIRAGKLHPVEALRWE